MKISFYGQHHGANETTYIMDCMKTSLSTGGTFSKQTLETLKQYFSQNNLLLTPTCSSSLELAIAMLPLHDKDEVLLPSFNFPSSANAILQAGATPVFCDIDPDTQNITLSEIEKRFTPKTKAIVTVDYAGIACDYNSILSFAKEYNLLVIEDAAQSLGSSYYGAPLGIQGDFSAVSFHHTKNVTCGEGGLFFCKDFDSFEQAKIYQMHGTNRQAFLDGQCDYYTWRQAGTSFPLSELSCALLLSQLEELDTITEYRKQLLLSYLEQLKPLEEKGIAFQMKVPDYCTPNGHIYYLRFANSFLAEKARLFLCSKGIDARTHYVPLHASPMGQKLGYKPEDLPDSMNTYHTLLRLPIHTSLTSADQNRICELLLDWGKTL